MLIYPSEQPPFNMQPSRTADWALRHSEIAKSDGPTWDRLSQEFDADWRRAYAQAFVDIAVSRKWSREAAESWPSNIVDDALTSAYVYDFCPIKAAKADVIACELESE